MHEQARYPHLLPQDAPLLTEYLRRHGDRYQSVLFDVRVGEGRDPGPGYDDNIRAMGLDLSRRRIDALGITKSNAHIIEVTGDAGTTTLGQLLAYTHLYQSDHPSEQIPRLILVCRALQSDMLLPFRAHNVEVHTYPNL